MAEIKRKRTEGKELGGEESEKERLPEYSCELSSRPPKSGVFTVLAEINKETEQRERRRRDQKERLPEYLRVNSVVGRRAGRRFYNVEIKRKRTEGKVEKRAEGETPRVSV